MARHDRRAPEADRDGLQAAYAAALTCIGRRELSTVQLRARLGARGFASDAIDAALDRLVSEGALDDGRAARALARTEARKHRGPLRIRQTVERAGVSREQARDVMSELLAEAPEHEALERAFARKRRQRALNLSVPADFRRAHAYLVRQGFSASAIGDFLGRQRRRDAGKGPDEEA